MINLKEHPIVINLINKTIFEKIKENCDYQINFLFCIENICELQKIKKNKNIRNTGINIFYQYFGRDLVELMF